MHRERTTKSVSTYSTGPLNLKAEIENLLTGNESNPSNINAPVVKPDAERGLERPRGAGQRGAAMSGAEREALEREIAGLIEEHAAIGYSFKDNREIDGDTLRIYAHGAAHVVVHRLCADHTKGEG
jgi:hypothetical protein